jgi:type VI protein secretion system component VasK
MRGEIMAIASCKDCNKEVSTEARKCPHCGRPIKPFFTVGKILMTALLVLLGLLFMSQKQADDNAAAIDARYKETMDNVRSVTGRDIDGIYDQVAEDAVRQYDIARRQGDVMQICVQAGFVTAGYLQAKNEDKYNRWKSIEKDDCKRAGLH